MRYKCANYVHRLIRMTSTPTSAPTAASSFDRFMLSLRDPDSDAPLISARRFAQALHIDLQTLAQQAHVHRNTISRLPESESVQTFLRQALRVICAATDVSSDVRDALFWYRNEPLAIFDYKTAEQLVSAQRTDDLLRYIASHSREAPPGDSSGGSKQNGQQRLPDIE